MPTVSQFIDKYNRRYDADEWEEGVNAYVNDPDFDNLFQEQKAKAVAGYEAAGAPATWKAALELGLSLVSADDFKTAITDPSAKDRYASAKAKALQKLQKKAYIPVEHANAVISVLDSEGIVDPKKRMDTNYAVGQHFKKAIYQKLLGDITASDEELIQVLAKMTDYGIGNYYDSNSGNPTTEGNAVLSILQTHRDNATNGLLQ